jgi:branched-chain amino acid transport system permease protein
MIEEILSRSRKWKVLAYGLSLCVLCLLPIVVKNEYIIRIFTMIFIYAVLALGLNFVVGFTGLLSFGHAAFYGIGAYTTAILMTRYGFGYVPALVASGIVTFIFGILLGLPVVRIRGDYLCLVTIAFGEIFRLLMQGWQSFSGGQMGIVAIPAPVILNYRITANSQFFYLGLILVVITFLILSIFANSKEGRAMIALREDELAASTMGINTAYYKVLNFAVGTAFAGVAGSLFAVYMTVVAPVNFTLGESVLMIVMVIVGGLGSLPGAVVGAAVLLFATELFRGVYQYRLLIIGFIMLIVLLWHPQGIMGIRAWRRVEEEGGK